MIKALAIDRHGYQEIEKEDCQRWHVLNEDLEQDLEEIEEGWLFTFLVMKEMDAGERIAFILQAFKCILTSPFIALIIWMEFTLERFEWIVEPVERFKQHVESASPHNPPERKPMSKEAKLFWIRYLSALGVLISILAVLIWMCATGRGF